MNVRNNNQFIKINRYGLVEKNGEEWYFITWGDRNIRLYKKITIEHPKIINNNKYTKNNNNYIAIKNETYKVIKSRYQDEKNKEIKISTDALIPTVGGEKIMLPISVGNDIKKKVLLIDKEDKLPNISDTLKNEIDNLMEINKACKKYVIQDTFYIYQGKNNLDIPYTEHNNSNKEKLCKEGEIVAINNAGKSLQEYLEDHKQNPLNRDTKLKIIDQLYNAVRCLHKNKYVHCDLKPQNIIIFDDGKNVELKLIDLSYDTSESHCKIGSLLYRPNAPRKGYIHSGKQFQDDQVDIFAMKVIILMILKNKTKFENMTTVNSNNKTAEFIQKEITNNLTNEDRSNLRRFFGHKINNPKALTTNKHWFKLDNVKVKEWCFKSYDYGIEIADNELYLKSDLLPNNEGKKNNGKCEKQESIGNNIHRKNKIFEGPNIILKKERSGFQRFGHSEEYALLFVEGDFRNNSVNQKKNIYYVTFKLDNGKPVDFILQAKFSDAIINNEKNHIVIRGKHNKREGKDNNLKYKKYIFKKTGNKLIAVDPTSTFNKGKRLFTEGEIRLEPITKPTFGQA